MTRDEAIKQACETIIAAMPTTYGSVKFNLQGKRKTVHANVTSKLSVECKDGQVIEVDVEESLQFTER